ncbi:MAG: hypothetical protein L6R38_007803 [Xanthoria sp. 2 TBL-2021]|nr:MAG: hypothetical protein L6R38_007803 [Xanthoria sp. 2 TBL-2021]
MPADYLYEANDALTETATRTRQKIREHESSIEALFFLLSMGQDATKAHLGPGSAAACESLSSKEYKNLSKEVLDWDEGFHESHTLCYFGSDLSKAEEEGQRQWAREWHKERRKMWIDRVGRQEQ